MLDKSHPTLMTFLNMSEVNSMLDYDKLDIGTLDIGTLDITASSYNDQRGFITLAPGGSTG